jgi:hypothetical protein
MLKLPSEPLRLPSQPKHPSPTNSQPPSYIQRPPIQDKHRKETYILSQFNSHSRQRFVSNLLVELNTEGTEAVEVDDITGSGNGAAGDLAGADAGQVDPAELGAAPDAGVQASKL